MSGDRMLCVSRVCVVCGSVVLGSCMCVCVCPCECPCVCPCVFSYVLRVFLCGNGGSEGSGSEDAILVLIVLCVAIRDADLCNQT